MAFIVVVYATARWQCVLGKVNKKIQISFFFSRKVKKFHIIVTPLYESDLTVKKELADKYSYVQIAQAFAFLTGTPKERDKRIFLFIYFLRLFE